MSAFGLNFDLLKYMTLRTNGEHHSSRLNKTSTEGHFLQNNKQIHTPTTLFLT